MEDANAPLGLPLDYIVNHVFLPPKLPQADDITVEDEVALTKLFSESLNSFIDSLPEDEQDTYLTLPPMLSILLDDGHLGSPLRNLRKKLIAMVEGDALALHITHQNAGLIIRRHSSTYSFESFELSPTSQASLCTGRLVRRFPGPAISVSSTRVRDIDFADALSECLETLEGATLDDAKTSGPGKHKDTIHPHFVTEFFSGILRGVGSPQEVPRIHKRTRDDALGGSEDGLEPWRRSPRWLLIKVAMQSKLARGGDHTRYKTVMLHFLATVLDTAVENDYPSDLLHVMLAKLNRRIQKLGLVPDDVQDFVTDTMKSAGDLLVKRWSLIQKSTDSLRLAELRKLKPNLDTVLQLPSLRPFLGRLFDDQTIHRYENAFDPKCSERIDGRGSSLPNPTASHLTTQYDIRLSLMDMELWVSHSLDSWLFRHINSEKHILDLSNRINWYMSKATSIYAGAPEGFSVMLLTVMMLWIALDKAALSHYPLLKKFDPGFPTALFDSLLLPKRKQMDQLRRVEQYLLSRKQKSSHRGLFTDSSSELSLGAQYFDQSPAHKELKKGIEQEALQAAIAKKAELKLAKAKYSKLMAQSNGLSCTSVERMYGRGRNRALRTVHDAYQCNKCKLANEAKALRISVHEWPLPTSEPAAKAVVFELDIPRIIRSFRATTFRILVDILNPSPSPQAKPNKSIVLTEYEGLAKYLKSNSDRLEFASSSKPFVQMSQYNSQAVGDATEESVCLPNNLTFAMQDAKSQGATSEYLNKYEVKDRCTFKLPQGSFSTLQYALSDTTHIHNFVISQQGSCPDGLTVHEAHAFAALRSGHRLQWLNIARELTARTLDFGKEEVYLLLLQASWQAGPPALNQVSRDSHSELEEEGFGPDLLSALESGLTSVESNWQGSVSVLTFVSIATRLVSMSLHAFVRNRCLEFLQRCRDVLIKWLRDVVTLLHNATEAGEISYLTARALDLGLICHSTFDVEPLHFPSLLDSADNVAILVETAVTVRDRWPVSEESLSPLTRELLRRFYRTSHALEPVLKRQIVASPDGMNKAVGRLWHGYEPSTPWLLASTGSRWLKAKAAGLDNVQSIVHWNALTGSLLINGRPLGRLPPDYESHSTYTRLFGSKILEVIPSSMTGMEFETRNAVAGFQIHFGIHDTELIVRASRGPELYEIIPAYHLGDDLPRSFIQDYVHVLNRETMEVELRPLESKWIPSSENWRILLPTDPDASLVLKSRSLVDPRSNTAEVIHQWLKPLENHANIHILYNDETKKTEICLPRLNLDFTLQKTGLESKQFRGMAIDTTQAIGSLTGLQNKLVLKGRASRIVIVPHGTVSYHRAKHHVQVSIATGEGTKIPYHQFVIDKDLGQLLDNGNLRSRLFKIYLHAVTSHCLPDNLTSRTGTEEALHGLRLASTQSFLSLDTEHVEILKLIAKLTPARDFSPKGSNFMQTVKWENLSPLSQHERFIKEVGLLLAQARSFQAFQPSDAKYKIEKRGSPELHDRAAIRNASYRVHHFGAEEFSSHFDAIYNEARDYIPNSPREVTASYISTIVDKWTSRLNPYRDLQRQFERWGPLIHGPTAELDYSFDGQWLQSPMTFMPENFMSMHSLLSKSDNTTDRFKITIFLANLAYSKHENDSLVHTLLALATVPALRHIDPPDYQYFDLSKGFEPNSPRLKSILESYKVSFAGSPERNIVRLPGELDEDLMDRRRAAYEAATNLQILKCSNALVNQWPSDNITRPRTPEIKTYLPGLKDGMAEIRTWFKHWYRNFEFRNYIQEIQTALDSLSLPLLPNPEPYVIPLQEYNYTRSSSYLKIDKLLRNQAPDLEIPQDDLRDLVSESDQMDIDTAPSKLKALLTKLSKAAKGHYEKDYVADLQKSYKALRANTSASPQLAGSPAFEGHLVKCKKNVDSMYKKICSRLIDSSSPVYESARHASLIPRLSPSILLRLLARFNRTKVSEEWKVALTRYALAIASMQRAERLVACGNRESDILNELTNGGHTNWDPMEYPEWLLLELESNILIRPEQAQIAREMIAPASGSNSIMQLNMGLGKSSVIVPIVAASLADGSKLARVVCLKSLSEPMFQLLVSKLGGLIGRCVYRLPITRSLAPTLDSAKLIQSTYEKCMASGGILLVQPENLLSFELLGIDYLLSPYLNSEPEEVNAPENDRQPSLYEIGKVMVKTQQWLYENARDVLDESDEILSVRFELIYTLGIQQNIEFSPDRWSIIMYILGILSETAREVLNEFPHGLEVVESSAGAFPRIRILHAEAGASLLHKTATFICRNGMPSLGLWTFSEEERSAMFDYVTDLQIPKARAAILETKVFETQFTKMSLLLLRGLFAAGVLDFVFAKKRYRVNYGLDLSRSMLAVPYHAKDNPSPRSEFSHPDTAIALTCLSYYYQGLTDEQIHASFEDLLMSDHAQESYVQWVQRCEDVPKTLKHLNGVNLRDKQQCSELFPLLRYSKGLIDYYLNHLVFPKQMKEFSNKLSSSGWEIAREKSHPTTGFSGTNDSKYLLPLGIKQLELKQQLATNAEVLACLLQPENSYDTEYTLHLETLDADALLDTAVTMVPPVRVLLDVGAQLLEDNEKIATSWLERVTPEDAQAVIFFHDNDIFVRNREGMMEPLMISPFAKQMDRCLVYLDEMHTRGTDLKMPANYRAIVTLGPDLTKDRLAQACKRLRKLGKGQSVVFCAPLEVRSKLLESSGKKDPKLLEVEDVLLWTMRNSWEFTKKGIPLWATQGMRHYRRRGAFDLSGEVPYIDVSVLEPEGLTLDERYGLDQENPEEGIVCRKRLSVDNDLTRREVCSIRAKCREFGLVSFGDSGLHEEQERELQPESEREQEVEPPPPTRPYKHVLRDSVKKLVSTGEEPSGNDFLQAVKVFHGTRARDIFNVNDWGDNLLVTQDFYHTVLVPNDGNTDLWLRPVNWILAYKGRNGEPKYLIMSPFEVQELLPQLRSQTRGVRLHVYTPRLSLSNRSLESLSYCAVPPVPANWSVPEISTTLNLFAGQLYLRDAKEYRKLCRFLGVRFMYPYRGVKVSADGFISPETRELQDDETAAICKFEKSPIDFLRMVFTFRRLGQGFATSHMGKVLSGELLRTMDFEGDERVEEDEDEDQGDPMDVDGDINGDMMDVDEDTVVVKQER